MASGFGGFLLLMVALSLVVGVIVWLASTVLAAVIGSNFFVLIALLIIIYFVALFIGYSLLFRGRSFR